MARGAALREPDVRAMLGFVSELASLETLDEFRSTVLPGLRKLVPCEIASYNEIDFPAGRMAFAADPPDSLIEDGPEVFTRLGHQNPLIERYERTRDGRPYKWSDLVTRRELHATELYHAAYARMSVEYQIAFCLPAPADLILGFALNRERRDFTERDRRVLNLVRSPMIQAYRTVERYAELAERLAAYERGLETNQVGVAVLERGRGGPAVAFASAVAGRTLGLAAGERLPGELQIWLERDRGDLAPEPLVLHPSEGDEVVVQFLPARELGGTDALLVEPAGELISLGTLRAAGLTPREAEVLRLVALGHTNPEIATELVVSPRTVQKHLENVYDKLGATSRTQAVVTAWSIQRRAPAADGAD